MANAIDTFICANSKNGFITLQNQLTSCDNLYIIKGGPGTGKSSFMKKIAAHYLDIGFDIELIHCSSDPQSLDGVYVREKSALYFDGTAPHTQDLISPGAGGRIIDLGQFWDESRLKERLFTIRELNAQIKNSYDNAYKILKVAGEVETVKDTICSFSVDEKKLKKYTDSLARRILKKSENGKITSRFSSAISSDGIISYKDQTEHLYKKIYQINDCYNYILPKILEIIINHAKNLGVNASVFYSPLCPEKAEYIYFEDLSLAIGNIKTDTPYMQINTSRFMDESFKNHKNRIKLYNKLKNYIISDAVTHLKTAKDLHDELEKEYIKNMNFDEVNRYCEEIKKEIK